MSKRKQETPDDRSTPHTSKRPKQVGVDKFFSKEQSTPTQSMKAAKLPRFVFFYGPKNTFSQFHPAKFTVDGQTYNCMEQYMHHQKAVIFEDSIRAQMILRTWDPKEHKKLGRQVQNFDKVTWGRKSVEVVKKGSEYKYLQNEDMKKKLFDTYPSTLVEASPRDRLWGIGLGASNPKAKNPATWRGKNLLGQCLTEVRDKLMRQEGLIPEKVVNHDSLTEQGSNPKNVSKQQGSNPEKVEKQKGSNPEKGTKQQGSSPEKGAKQQGSSPEKGAKQQGSNPEKVEKQQGSSPEKGAKQQGSNPEKVEKQQGSSPEKGAKQQGSSPEKGLKKS